MKKRGISQVDWAVSLSLFLLYIAWFFIFVRPMFIQDDVQESLLNVVEENFLNDYTWAVNKLPIIIKPNITNAYEPMVLEFPYLWNQNNSRLNNNKEFVFDNGKILFLGNLANETKIFWLLNSIGNYTSESTLKDLNANGTVATTGQDLKVEFRNNLFKTVTYKDNLKLNHTDIYIEDDVIEMSSNFSNIYDSVAIYRIISQGVNHTSYVFAKNSVIYNYVNLNMNGSYTLRLYMDLYDYENYYATNNLYGYINYSYPNCISLNHDSITFHNGDSITFKFNSTATIRFCFANRTTNLNISLSLENETYYKVYFHDGDYSNIDLSRYSYDLGAVEKEKGLYLDKIENIDYESLKTNWSYPNRRDFRITIWNTTSANLSNRGNLVIKDFGASGREIKDIAVKEWDDHILTKEANLYKALVNIKAW